MTPMVQVAVAGAVTEGEELQAILETAGIESTLEAAQDAIEALTEPDGRDNRWYRERWQGFTPG